MKSKSIQGRRITLVVTKVIRVLMPSLLMGHYVLSEESVVTNGQKTYCQIGRANYNALFD